MTDSIGSLLANRQIEKPSEIEIIQDFIANKFNVTPAVTVQDSQIIISVKGSALAGALRPFLHNIQQLCHTEKRLVLRIL